MGSLACWSCRCSVETILNGTSFVDITVTVIENQIAESSETIDLTLTSSDLGSIAGNTNHVLTITANDAPGVSLTLVTGDTEEDGSPATQTFTVVLDTEPPANVVLPIR